MTDATQTQIAYARIGDLEMYYEIHGQGPPLLLLHGGYGSIQSSFADLRPILAKTHRVIAPEQQAHGHTADIDRPLSIAAMVEDTAALMEQLGVEGADVFGYSMGGCIALGLAVLYPNRVHRLAVLGANYNNAGLQAATLEALASSEPARVPERLRREYDRVAPHPEDWPRLEHQVTAAMRGYPGWSTQELGSIQAPALVMLGDRDIVVRLEHAAELYHLLPDARLAVLPATGHVAPTRRAELILPILTEFLDA